MGEARKHLMELDDDEKARIDEDRTRRRDHEESERKSRESRAASHENARRAFGHLADILVRGKKPSRDPSTWGDRTGAEDQAYEKEQRREKSLKEHRTKAGFFGTRG